MSSVSDDEETDSVWGYCGLKENHECGKFYTTSVGDDPQAYERLLKRMEESKLAENARVIMINPLHHRLPRIVMHLQATCMCFDHNMVLHQWLVYAELAKKHIEPIVGPCIGQGSDDDSRRRKLHLAKSSDSYPGHCFKPVSHEHGFLFLCGLDLSKDMQRQQISFLL